MIKFDIHKHRHDWGVGLWVSYWPPEEVYFALQIGPIVLRLLWTWGAWR